MQARCFSAPNDRLCCTHSQAHRLARVRVRTCAQAERRVVRITVAGPPDGQPPRVIELDDPQVVPAEVVSLKELQQQELQARQASISKSEAREQAALIQAQRQEITSLRQALAETQDVMLRGKQTYNEVVHTKDMQIAQLYELAANGVRERAKLRQEVNEVQHELLGTRRQLHAFMASLMQLKSSMASAGEGDMDHALELLQSSSFSQSLQNAANFSGSASALAGDDEVLQQLKQMQQLSETLVQDMRQDEALLSRDSSSPSSSSPDASYSDFNSLDSFDMHSSSNGTPSSSSSSRMSWEVPHADAVHGQQTWGPGAQQNGGGSSGGSGMFGYGGQVPGGNGSYPGNGTSSSSSNGSSGWNGHGSHAGR